MAGPARELAADELAKRYRAVRAASLGLAESLSAEDAALQSMPDASPIKWHLAHTSWYFETFVLEPQLPGYRPYRAEFKVLFNSYYHSVGEQHARPERGLLSRPSLEAVLDYREHVDRHVASVLEGGQADRATLEVARLGTHHEQQHQELMLTDLKHLFSRNPLEPVYRSSGTRPLESRAGGDATFLPFAGGLVEIGHCGEGFAFDNEGPRHRVYLEPYELASRPVTNAEYLAFIEDGGYREPAHWLSDGWDRVCEREWEAPLYWRRRDEAWSSFTLAGRRALQPDEPVCHLSYFEADAYARWAGARLPSEAEWEHAAGDVSAAGHFVESDRLHPRPAEPEGGSPRQLFGDVWEWTRSAYAPYPGYRPPAGALGEYNGKFMSGQMVLRGGSCVSPADHLRASYRNFFHPDARWQFSGLRLARDFRS